MWLGAAECVFHWGAYEPERSAILADGQCITYGALTSAAAALARDVKERQISGRRIGIICRDKVCFLSALFGLQFAGNSPVIFHPTWDDTTLAATIADTMPVALIVGDRDQERAGERWPQLPIIPIINETRKARESFSFNDSLQRLRPEQEWGVVFSSGSTGLPKPIVQTQYSNMTECVAWCIELGLVRDQSFYITRPLYYTGGLALALASLMTRGLLIIDNYDNNNNPDEILEELRRAAALTIVDRCFFVPEVIRPVLLLPQKVWEHTGNPKQVLLMGSKIHDTEKQKVSEYFGCEVVESWGNSEGLGTITDPHDLIARPSSIGRPFLTEQLWIMDEQLKPLPSRQVGRIVGSDETMFKEYANRPEATQLAKREDLVISDDVGFRDEQGYFYILGREEDVVILPGSTISVMNIESELRQSFLAREVFVGIVRKADSIDVAVLVVPSTPNVVDITEVKLRVEAKLSGMNATVKACLVSEIPKLASGKVDRIRARALAFVDSDG
jgi:acyl-CoA synthetase (AMP-forming)/AMP-acid ligase II